MHVFYVAHGEQYIILYKIEVEIEQVKFILNSSDFPVRDINL